jgi:hypothetical protein
MTRPGEELVHWAKSCRRCPTSQENCSWSHYRQGLLSFPHSLAHVSTVYVEQHSSFDKPWDVSPLPPSMAIFVPELLAWWRILWPGKAGALAIAVASPTDLVKVRLQAEGKLPPGVPRRYSGAMNAYSTIAKQVYFQWHTLLVLQGVWYVYSWRPAQQKHLLSFYHKTSCVG